TIPPALVDCQGEWCRVRAVRKRTPCVQQPDDRAPRMALTLFNSPEEMEGLARVRRYIAENNWKPTHPCPYQKLRRRTQEPSTVSSGSARVRRLDPMERRSGNPPRRRRVQGLQRFSASGLDTHTSQSTTASRRDVSGSRVGLNSWAR